jgi:dTDP-4-dehydrorhamnose 3,5-epimerase
MRFETTAIAGVTLVELEPRGDDRGFFARLFCAREFEGAGLDPRVLQINDSTSRYRGTLRGLHYQVRPAEETKLVRCIRGALYDVVLDLRPESATYGQYWSGELTAENRRMVFVPRGCAHGFLTLADDTEAMYLVSQPYSPTHERGIRWDDPTFHIEWPFEPLVISDKDRRHPLMAA